MHADILGTSVRDSTCFEQSFQGDDDVQRIDGHQLTLNRIERIFSQLNGMTREERAQIPGMEAGRADIILPALLILLGLCHWLCQAPKERLSAQTITVTVRGARYGILSADEVAS